MVKWIGVRLPCQGADSLVAAKGEFMLEPVFDVPRDEWDERDWEQFLQRADARTAKYQELYETLAQHPQRDTLIAHEMGWEEELKGCGGSEKCPSCRRRCECEAYEMMRLVAEPKEMDEDPDSADLIACFEQLRDVPAYCQAQDFSSRVEEYLREHLPGLIDDHDVRGTLFAAQLVPAQVAGGHGIGYDRASLCGNIANCKRAMRSLDDCLECLGQLHCRRLMPSPAAYAFIREAESVRVELDRWIEALRARVWWR